jgi:hypothetical protein
MPQIAADTIELPGQQGVALAQAFQAGVQPGSVIALAGGVVVVEALRWNARRQQRVALQVEHLRSVGLAHPHVADQHRDLPAHKRSIT